MALNPATLSALIKSKLLADAANSKAVDNAALTSLCNCVAQACVEHIVAAAVVTVPPGVAVATTGTAAAQTGATTAPGVGTVA
jgi:nicotinamide mononucleotide (NMN) deamidase PncC